MNQLYAEAQSKAGMHSDPLEPSKTMSNRTIDDNIAEVLDSDDDLRKFYNLRRKALRTAAEQQEYLAMISNKQLIADARADLLAAATSSSLDQNNELKRLQRIQFLNSALAWEDNPERTRVVEVVSEAVMSDIPESARNALKGSVLGDKFDLFQLLIDSDLNQARALLTKVRGTPSEKILQFAWRTSRVGQSEHISSP